MANYNFFITSSLEKVFPNIRPVALTQSLSTTLEEKISVQLCYFLESPSEVYPPKSFKVEVKGDVEEVQLRNVELIASQLPCTENNDQYYLSTTPGLFPDLLTPNNGIIRPLFNQFKSLWVDFKFSKPGVKYLTFSLTECGNEYYNGQELPKELLEFTAPLTLEVIDKKLPKFDIIHTEWFHSDCLADYYNVEAWSEKHWAIVQNFIKTANKDCYINAILTPIFTQPLDTQVNGERTTVQLCNIFLDKGQYSFDFSLLARWCAICKAEGIEYLELAHLFTQWGAQKTPKIFVKENGKLVKKFGWHVDATDSEYRKFLEAFLPALIKQLNLLGYDKQHLLFHISDEPTEAQLESYKKAKDMVADLLKGCTIVDALSSFEFYKKGVLENPIPANDHIQPFIDNGVENLWTYYCVAQGSFVPNRFFSLPSARNRIMGLLMYYYNIKGFLHWGYNFYNSAYSINHIDPYNNSTAGNFFPSGDAYLVYPASNYEALLSLRAEVQTDGFDDYRALRLLEKKMGREYVISLIDKQVGYKITFKHYPRSSQFLLEFRNTINTLL